jgi:putative toxin-antitoxin system antitoxin component (TIGR02293 family)
MSIPTAIELNKTFMEWLGTAADSEQKVVRLVEAGLNGSVVARLIENGLTGDEVSRLIITPRTLKHRNAKGQSLSLAESECAIRIVRTIAIAQSVLGDRHKALRWLRKPKGRFEGRAPIDMLSTEPGGRLVEQMLIQIDEGAFA